MRSSRLGPRGGTSFGQASSLRSTRSRASRISIDQKALQDGQPQPSVHFLGSAVVILLTDGENTARLDPLAVAPVAAQAGVRIYPIGIGSPNGAVVDIDGFRVATDARRPAAPRDRASAAAASTSRPGTPRRSIRSTAPSISSSRSTGARPRSPRSWPARALFLFLAGARLSMRWYGRVI